MANPRKRRLTQLLRQSQHDQLTDVGRKMLEEVGILSQPAEELLKVSKEVPEGTPLVEVELKVGKDESNVVDEALLEELLKEKEDASDNAKEKLSYSARRKQAIAEKVAAKKKEDD